MAAAFFQCVYFFAFW